MAGDRQGYNVKDDGVGMFTVQQNGANGIGFALALDIDTPAGVPGGLIMSNKGGTLFPGTDQATPATANVLPIGDSARLDWHEFWITIQDAGTSSAGRPILDVDVFADGSLAPAHFEVQSLFTAAFPGQFLAFGLPSTTSFGAVDIDFYSYKLGVGLSAPGDTSSLARSHWPLDSRRSAPDGTDPRALPGASQAQAGAALRSGCSSRQP